MDLTLIAGIGTAPVITQVVQYAKEEWKLSSKLAPILSLILGIGLNAIIGYLLTWDVRAILATGILNGFIANVWYEKTK